MTTEPAASRHRRSPWLSVAIVWAMALLAVLSFVVGAVVGRAAQSLYNLVAAYAYMLALIWLLARLRANSPAGRRLQLGYLFGMPSVLCLAILLVSLLQHDAGEPGRLLTVVVSPLVIALALYVLRRRLRGEIFAGGRWRREQS